MALEFGLTLCKPDALRRGLVGKIISRFENKGLTLVDLAVTYPTKAMIEAMYADKKDEGNFPALLEYMLSGPVVAMLWQGEEANKALRLVVGSKDPLESPPGSLRGDYAGDTVKTLVHGSRNPEEAYSEAKIWFADRFGAEPVSEGKAADEGREIAEPGKLILPDGTKSLAYTWLAGYAVFDPTALTLLKTFEPLEVP